MLTIDDKRSRPRRDVFRAGPRDRSDSPNLAYLTWRKPLKRIGISRKPSLCHVEMRVSGSPSNEKYARGSKTEGAERYHP